MKILHVLFLAILCPLTAAPQRAILGFTDSKDPVYSEKQQKLRSQKFQAVSMIEKTAEDAVFWEDRKAGVEALADSADLLWNENAVRSANWLNCAWRMADEVSEPKKDEKLAAFFTASDRANLRTAILKVARKRDEVLFEKLMKQLAAKEADEKKDRGAFDDRSARSEQLLRLAQQAIETDPNLAFNLAAQSLVDGISYSLQNVLTDLRKKDVNLANRLFDLALGRLRNGADPSEAQTLAGYLFNPGFTMANSAAGDGIVVVNPAQQNLPAVAISEPARAGDFLDAAYQSFFTIFAPYEIPENRGQAENVMLLGSRILGHYARYAPALAQPAGAFFIRLRQLLHPDFQSPSGDTDSTQAIAPKNATKEESYKAMIDYLEEKADKAGDPISKKLAYIKAALATNGPDYARGVKIAEKIDDENLEADAVSFIYYRAALYFVEKKDVETAVELVPKIREPLRRSVAQIAVAQFLLQPKDKKATPTEADLEKQRAFSLLDDVQRDLKKEEASLNLVRTLLGATTVLAKCDKPQGLSSLEQAIQIINRLPKFDLKESFAPRLNLDVSSASSSTVSTPRMGFGFRNAIEPLIGTDFDQIALMAERFSARETRGIGRLEVAKLFFQQNKQLLSKP